MTRHSKSHEVASGGLRGALGLLSDNAHSQTLGSLRSATGLHSAIGSNGKATGAASLEASTTMAAFPLNPSGNGCSGPTTPTDLSMFGGNWSALSVRSDEALADWCCCERERSVD